MKLSKSMAKELEVAGDFGMKIPKSLSKELRISGAASEKKVNEILAGLAEAAEAAQSKEAIAGIQDAIRELRAYKQATIEAFQRVDAILDTPHEYDVEIVRGEDGLAKRFIMRPHKAGVYH